MNTQDLPKTKLSSESDDFFNSLKEEELALKDVLVNDLFNHVKFWLVIGTMTLFFVTVLKWTVALQTSVYKFFGV